MTSTIQLKIRWRSTKIIEQLRCSEGTFIYIYIYIYIWCCVILLGLLPGFLHQFFCFHFPLQAKNKWGSWKALWWNGWPGYNFRWSPWQERAACTHTPKTNGWNCRRIWMIWWVFWVWLWTFLVPIDHEVENDEWFWSKIFKYLCNKRQTQISKFFFWSLWIQRCDHLRFLLNPDRDSHHHTPSHDWWLDDAWWLARSHHSWYGLPSSFAQVSVCLAFGRLLWHGHGYDYCLRIGCRNLVHTRHHPFDLDIKFSVLAMTKIGSRHGNQHGNSFCLSNLPDSPWYSGDRLVSINPDPAWYRGYTAFVSLSISHEHGLVGRPFFAGGECLCTSVIKRVGNASKKDNCKDHWKHRTRACTWHFFLFFGCKGQMQLGLWFPGYNFCGPRKPSVCSLHGFSHPNLQRPSRMAFTGILLSPPTCWVLL